MPSPSNIESFDNPINGLEAPQGGFEARMREGRYVGALYRQVGQDVGGDIKGLGDAYVAHQTQQEITRGQSATAQLWSQMTVMRDRIGNSPVLGADGKPLKNADGTQVLESSQPDYHVKVLQATQDMLGNMGSTFKTEGGQRWFGEFSSRFQDEMAHQVMADTSEAQGAQHVKDEQNTTVSMGQAAEKDPTQWQALLGASKTTHDPSLSTPVLMEPGKAAISNAALSQERGETIISGAVRGYSEKLRDAISVGNDATAKTAEDGLRGLGDDPNARPYLKEDIDERIDQARKEGTATYQSTLHNAKVNQNSQANQVMGDISAKLFTAETSGHAPDADTMAEIANFNRAFPQAREQLSALQDHALRVMHSADSGENTISDPGVLSSFNSRLSIPAGQPGALTPLEIVQASTGQHPQISPKAGKELLDHLKAIQDNPQLAADRAALEKEITPPIRSALGLVHTPATFDDNGNMVGGDGGPGNLQGEIAASMFQQEARTQYEAIAAKNGPEAALKALTDPKVGWISHHIPLYKQAANSPDAQAFLARYGVGEAGAVMASGALGSSGGPIKANDPGLAKVKAAGRIKPGESWTAYKQRAGL